MFDTTEIRRLANGSIDVEHYSKLGKNLHGTAIYDACVAVIIRLLKSPTKDNGAFEIIPAE